MPQDFSGQNLRGRSFKGVDLTGADFSCADIRSTDFTGAILRETKFCRAKAGLQRLWAIFLVMISWLLGGISGFFSALAGGMVSLIVYDSNYNSNFAYQVAGWASLVLLILFLGVIIRFGIEANIATIAGAFAIVFAGIVAFAIAVLVVERFAIAIAGVFAIAGMLTILGTLAAAVAIAFLIAGVFAVVGVLAFALTFAVIGTYPLKEGYAVAFAVAVVVVFSLAGTYIAWKALTGEEKYADLHKFAIAITAFKGTNFCNADLTNANFTQATLKSTNFCQAKLTRTCFQKVKTLDRVHCGATYLKHPQLREVLITGYGQEKKFDNFDLRGVNLKGANLADASFICADLSEANLQDTDLSRAKLVQTQLSGTDFTGSTLTGAYIEDWGITNNTIFTGVKCQYVYMKLPTKNNPDPLRKPDNLQEVFADGEFGDFIKPIFDTLDLYHNQGVDPRAIAISLKQLAENNAQAVLRIVGMEVKGKNNFLLRAKTALNTDKSRLSAEYFNTYNQLKGLRAEEMKLLLAEQDSRISNVENMVQTALQSSIFLANPNYYAVKTILILAANPKATSSLRLDEEVREIDAGLQRAKKREQFDLKQRWAVRIRDVSQALLDFKPRIVHFSGHGSGDDGLMLEDEIGNMQLVDGEALAELFKLFADNVECVLLNACYSEVQAAAIVKYVPYVIGMNQAIGDKASIEFAVGFYSALGAGESIEFAYQFGCSAIQLVGSREHLTPVLKKK